MSNDIYLVRHGQSLGNADRTVYTKMKDCDVPLTENGAIQSKTVGKMLSDMGLHWNIWYSPYRRVVQTKDYIVQEIGTENIGVCNMNVLLRERHWGKLQHIVDDGLKTEDHFNFFYKPEGGESFADLYQRVVVFDTLMETYKYTKCNLIVSHGEFLKVYIMYKCGWDLREFEKWKTPRNAQVHKLSFNGVGWNLSPSLLKQNR